MTSPHKHGTGGGAYRAGCPGCQALRREASSRRRSTPEGREANRTAVRAVHVRRRTRTEAEADADFLARWPNGKPCKSCGEVLSAGAFNRNWSTLDGRRERCNQNGCYNRHQSLKRWHKLVPHWIARGLDPDACAYCLRPISPGDRDVDHFQPVALGGADDPDNLIPACPDCNRGQAGKFHRPPFEWLAATHPDRLDFFRALFKEVS